MYYFPTVYQGRGTIGDVLHLIELIKYLIIKNIFFLILKKKIIFFDIIKIFETSKINTAEKK